MTIKREKRNKTVLSIVLAIICIIYIMPILVVLMNSFKTNASVNTDTFAFPNSDTFVGFKNYIKGMTFGNYPFYKSVFFSFFRSIFIYVNHNVFKFSVNFFKCPGITHRILTHFQS